VVGVAVEVEVELGGRGRAAAERGDAVSGELAAATPVDVVLPPGVGLAVMTG
jgi:hypothetical protein